MIEAIPVLFLVTLYTGWVEERAVIRDLQAHGAKVAVEPMLPDTVVNEMYLWFYPLPRSFLDRAWSVELYDATDADAVLPDVARLSRVWRLVLRRSDVTDAGLASLTKMKCLLRLELSETKIGDAGLVYVGRLRSLRELYAWNTKITDEGLEHLVGLPLVSLMISGTAVSDDGLTHLEKIRTLEFIDLRDTRVTEGRADALRNALPDVHEMDLGKVPDWAKPGHCVRCGHDLTGNVSGVCPECGQRNKLTK